MSTGVDSRRPTGFWSYIPFRSTSPRRRSVSLPYRANNGDISNPFDPFEKPYRHSSTGVGIHSSSPTLLESLQNAWMTQSQRYRYFKASGAVVFVLCILLYLSGGKTGLSGVGGMKVPLLGQSGLIKKFRKHIYHFWVSDVEMYETA